MQEAAAISPIIGERENNVGTTGDEIVENLPWEAIIMANCGCCKVENEGEGARGSV